MSPRPPPRDPAPDHAGGLEGPRRLLALAWAGLGAAYLVWRAGTLDAHAPLLSGGLYALECLGYLLGLLQVVTGWRTTARPVAWAADPTALDTLPGTPPDAAALEALATDTLVLAGDAEPAVIRKTLLAALAMTGGREVLLLDDGSQAVCAAGHAERAALARALDCPHLAHPDGLAAALAHGRSPRVLLLRAGDAPRRDCLLATAPAFGDPRVAALQLLPVALNAEGLPHGRRAGPATDARADPVAQLGRAGWGAALLNGSGALIRRDALAQVGGLALDTGPCRDLQTAALQASLRLQAAGWRITCTDAPLLFRLTADTAAGLPANPSAGSPAASFANRPAPAFAPAFTPASAHRAALGAWGVWGVGRREGLLLLSLRRGLSLPQRLCALGALLAPLDSLRLGLLTLLPTAVLLGGGWPVDAPVADFVLRAGAWTLLSLWLADELGRGRRRVLTQRVAQLGRFAAALGALTGRPAGVGAQAQVHPNGHPNGHPTVHPHARPLQALVALHAATLLAGALAWTGLDVGIDLPSGALLATAAWAGAALGLSLAALRQTRQPRTVGRASHRFPIPLAAELICPGGERLAGTIDDLSEAGLRFYGTLLPSITIGQAIAGFLHLPDGPLPFEGTVRHLGGETDAMHLPRSIGCSLELADGARRRLETFLYTTALPWQAQGGRPRTHTLLSALLPGQVDGPPARPLAPRRWNAAQLRRHVNAPTLPALLAAPDPRHGDDLLISYAPLPEGQPLILDVFRRMAVPSRGVTLTAVSPAGDGVTAGVPGLHAYRVEVAAMPRVPAAVLATQDPTLLYDDAPVWAPDEPHPVPRTVVSDPLAYQPLELDHV